MISSASMKPLIRHVAGERAGWPAPVVPLALLALLVIAIAGCASKEAPEAKADARSHGAEDVGPETRDPERYGPQSWQGVIAADCRSFFDGCNHCRREPGMATAACTRRACPRYEAPRCLDEPIAAAPPALHVDYRCAGGEQFRVFYGEYVADDQRLRLPGDEIVLSDEQTHTAHHLTRRPSASGERYGSDALEFWAKGREAQVRSGGEPLYRSCEALDR